MLHQIFDQQLSISDLSLFDDNNLLVNALIMKLLIANIHINNISNLENPLIFMQLVTKTRKS